jgi:hypothetical protein
VNEQVEKEPAEILRAARERIKDPERWTQSGAFACAADGRPMSPFADLAVCWCVRGSLYRETWSVSAAHEVEMFLREAMGADFTSPDFEELAAFNDAPETTHADVLALYDRAIDLATSTPPVSEAPDAH